MTVPIVIGSDEAGATLRRLIAVWLREQGYEVLDFGVDDDSRSYPSIARSVAEQVRGVTSSRAILVCGTGIGMAIAANKVPGVYAAQCHDTYSAERARKSNNAQILTLGARVVGVELARSIVDTWLSSEFEGGRSAAKVAEVKDLEETGRA